MKNYTYLAVFFAFMAISCLEATKNPSNRAGSGDSTQPATPDTNDRRALNELRTSVLTEDLMSHVHRTVGAEQYSYSKLNEKIRDNQKPVDIHTIPKPDVDTDDTVIKYTNTPENCGYGDEIDTISKRLNDCKAKNGDKYQWKGDVSGNSGEGTWTLLQVNGAARFWIDANTGLIWSSIISATTWNNASGSGVTDAEKRCSESSFSIFKFTEGEISWRLPNRNEFLQAHLNGSRHVISHSDKKYWTATATKETEKAWAIDFSTSVLEKADRSINDVYSVICIGEVLK
jgi:hypothetical protein